MWQQAIALLVELKVRNGIGEKDLAGAVETALHHSAGGRSAPEVNIQPTGRRKARRTKAEMARAHATHKCEDCGVKVASRAAGHAASRGGGRAVPSASWRLLNPAGPPICISLAYPASHLCTEREWSLELPQASSLGLPVEGKARWCSGCAKAHAGAVDIRKEKCEGCGLKHSNFGLPAEGKRRWCAGCAKGHAGAVSVSKKNCEDCKLKRASCGLRSELTAVCRRFQLCSPMDS